MPRNYGLRRRNARTTHGDSAPPRGDHLFDVFVISIVLVWIAAMIIGVYDLLVWAIGTTLQISR
jgi:hypothetical protein